MNNLVKIIPAFINVILMQEVGYSQHLISETKVKFVFSAIAGSVSKPESILLPPDAASFKLMGDDTSAFRIFYHKNGKNKVAFVPAVDCIGTAKAQVPIKIL